MAHEGVCLERRLLVPDAKLDEVVVAAHRIFKEMGLKITEEKKTEEGKISVMAREGALVPLTLRVLLYPFSLEQYIRAAQRSGVHVVISPSEEGVAIYSCGLAIDELTGKPFEYASDEDIAEVTDTMEALDFENRFLKKMKAIFPKTREVE
jgi:hypothetical protein